MRQFLPTYAYAVLYLLSFSHFYFQLLDISVFLSQSLQGNFALFKIAKIIYEPSEIKPVKQGYSGDLVLFFNSSFCHYNLLITMVR